MVFSRKKTHADDGAPATTELDRVVSCMCEANSVLVVTGAGMSADSGLPTYRGIGGLYNENLTEDSVPIEQALSGEMMQRAPSVTWRYIAEIESASRGAVFNRGHAVIREMGEVFERFCVLTQNIDGFHRDAGSENVVEIHGNIHNLSCMRCDYRIVVSDYSGLEMPPRCPRCEAVIRPDVVLFGEMLPRSQLLRFRAELNRGFDLVFSVGTTSVFPYIAEPVLRAAGDGKPTVEINPGESEVSRLVTHRLKTRAVTALEPLWRRYRERAGA